MKGLTLRQNEILGFLWNYWELHQNWPSIREIQEHFQFRSTNAVAGHLRALERKGMISRDSGKARTYRINSVPGEGALGMAASWETFPVDGEVAAGFPDRVESAEATRFMSIPGAEKWSGKARLLKVRGDSMKDANILDGDFVLYVSPRYREPRDQDIVVALTDHESTLKRLVKPRKGRPYLKAENSRYPDIHPAEELVIQGVVIKLIRDIL